MQDEGEGEKGKVNFTKETSNSEIVTRTPQVEVENLDASKKAFKMQQSV